MPDSAMLGVFVAASLVLLLTPGPAVLYIVTRSIDQGWIAGVVSSLGMAVGSLVHVTIAWLGMSAILFSSETAFVALRYAGTAYLVYLGIQTLRAGDHAQAGGRLERQGLKRVFSQAIVVNLLNPKSALFFVAFMPQFVDVSRGTVAGQLLFLCGATSAPRCTSGWDWRRRSRGPSHGLRSRRARYPSLPSWHGTSGTAATRSVPWPCWPPPRRRCRTAAGRAKSHVREPRARRSARAVLLGP